ncbi:hypothetical protein SAMN04488109_1811 [Chryseolinea serpens]|uniref:Uncharacterized protein n=1 Tax=Chryseolinea serpens TaxID=947013 RepID=A0A1M5MLY3_9BACT|nr:hypothetical protein [Chryseolinea serpens]SHG78255.1 hypothetical protein SAMN04488109_1811 [Chryseolinea serpens]
MENTPVFNPKDYDPQPLIENSVEPGLPLIKWCHPQHNLARGCSTIFLGTTHYYKNLETEIGDKTEGTAVFGQDYQQGGLIMANNLVVMEKIPSVYIFCASYRDEKVFEGYNDKYYITDPHRFLVLLAQVLANTLEPSDFEPQQVSGLSINPPYTVYPKMEKITYLNTFQHWGVNYSSRLILENSAFRKPQTYSRENEVRMGYVISHPGQKYILNTKPEPKILDFTPIRAELDKVIALEI